MQRLDDKEDELFVKACVYGPPGTGKTSFGVTAPEPLIALTERQGMTHIKQAAKRLGIKVPQTLFIEKASDLRNLVRALHGDRSKPFRVLEKHQIGDGENAKVETYCVHEGDWPQTIVIDSMTDACRLLVEEIREQSPQQRGRDGLPIDSQRFWQVLIQRTQGMVLSLRDLPMHGVFLALADDREKGDDDNKVRSVTPKMSTRDLSTVLAAAVNVVGYTYRRTSKRQNQESHVEYGILTTGPEYMLTKPYRPLRDQEVPDFSYWVKVIMGEVNDRPAPAPSQEVGGGQLEVADRPLTAERPPVHEAAPDNAAAAEAEQPIEAAPKAKARARRAG